MLYLSSHLHLLFFVFVVLNIVPIDEFIFGKDRNAPLFTVVGQDLMQQLLLLLSQVAESKDLFAYPFFPHILFIFTDDTNHLQLSLQRVLLLINRTIDSSGVVTIIDETAWSLCSNYNRFESLLSQFQVIVLETTYLVRPSACIHDRVNGSSRS